MAESVSEQPVLVRQYQLVTLEAPLELESGRILPAGATLLLVPQTTADSVRVPGGGSLADAWSSLSRTNHDHADMQRTLAGFQTELARLSRRVTELESSLPASSGVKEQQA